ncbi:MAG: hypothetical protein JWM81_1090 [Candidatus Saccharibacteria bacterium]|nr:hypothetical protein [Candidatus Saccharibacteria bacterium]
MPEGTTYGELREPCAQDSYGAHCGAILCQKFVLATFDPESWENSLDTVLGMITAQARFTSLPEGEAPEEIREVVQHTILPLRERRPLDEAHVFVNPYDLVLSLMNQGKVHEANWYLSYNADRGANGEQVEWWAFQSSETSVSQLATPRSSLSQYDGSATKGNAALWNSFVPPLWRARQAIDGSVLPRTVQIRI